jgi:hypothetical protein
MIGGWVCQESRKHSILANQAVDLIVEKFGNPTQGIDVKSSQRVS